MTTISGITEGSQLIDTVEVIEVNILNDEVIVIEADDQVVVGVADDAISVTVVSTN